MNLQRKIFQSTEYEQQSNQENTHKIISNTNLQWKKLTKNKTLPFFDES